MKTGSVTLPEVIEALKVLGGKAQSREIENYIIENRGNILPKVYEFGGWDSYRKTINQVIQFYCPRYKKYKGKQYFEKLGPGYYKLYGYTKEEKEKVIESRKYESYKHSHKYLISEEELNRFIEKNKLIGINGEEIVVEYEKNELIKFGRKDLASLVKRISVNSINSGYDVTSYDKDGNKKFIEVKSSKSDNSFFYLTDNELEMAKQLKNQYWIYRVLNLDGISYQIVVIQNPYSKIENGEWSLSPLTYLVNCP